MSPQLDLSVVDQSPVRSGATAAEALRETIELAEKTEALGYRRFWVAEHHNLPGFAGTSPEILVGQIAARTSRLRVGTGGVMLSHYSALRVAESFRVLEALYPGRIDLGIGRAPGGDQQTLQALAYPGRPRDISLYPEQVDDLIAYLEDRVAPGHRFEGIRAAPTEGTAPEVWLLGSGIDSALLAAERGLPFSYAHFFGAGAAHGPQVVAIYRERFRPSEAHEAPRVNVTTQVVCADSDEEAERLASSLAFARLRLARGVPGPIASPEEALAYPYDPAERRFVEAHAAVTVIGGPDAVRAHLLRLAEEFGTRDVGVVTICHDFGARLHSYELVARSFGMTGSSDA